MHTADRAAPKDWGTRGPAVRFKATREGLSNKGFHKNRAPSG